ncbi:MAG: hypothetical protein M1825_006081 [Sarcosagium campestre]|nr:MAG: hypothetical protein M1825_006081 [Sarcosagium campestre]
MKKASAPSSSRSAVRNVAMGSVGLTANAALSTVLPWFIIPTALSLGLLIRDGKRLSRQRRTLAAQGLRLKRRDISRAVVEALAIKGVVMFVTLGHDDILALSHSAANQLFEHGIVGAGTEIVDWGFADADRTDGQFLHLTTEAPGAPIASLQEGLGLDTVANVAQPGHGWQAGTAELAQQVVVVGTAQAAVEKIIDSASKPVIVQLDSHGK